MFDTKHFSDGFVCIWVDLSCQHPFEIRLGNHRSELTIRPKVTFFAM